MLVMGESSVSGNGVLTVRCVRFYHAGVTHRRLVTAALAITTALVACTGASTPNPDHSGPGVAGSGQVSLPTSPEALPLVDVAGYHQLLAGLHGTPVVVNVWASWCGPCRDEAPLLRQAFLDHPSVQFLGVDVQDSRDGAVGFIRRYAIPYPSLFDPPGDIRTALGLQGQPDTLFYDTNGVLLLQVLGPLRQSALDQGLAKIAA
jgi:thiol-disulfide isomerase/thioredoxin